MLPGWEFQQFANSDTWYKIELSVTDQKGFIGKDSLILFKDPLLKSESPSDPLSIRFYPNPVVDGVGNLILASDHRDEMAFEILDVFLRVIDTRSLQLNAGINSFMLDLHDIPNGLYYLKFTTKHGSSLYKIVISKGG